MFRKVKKSIKNLEYNNVYPLFFTLLFILILIQYSFHSLDALFYDLWVRSDFVSTADDNVITVTMDDESDQFLGEVYPYTYATHIRFLKKVVEDKPRAISFILPFSDPGGDQTDMMYEFRSKILDFKDEHHFFQIGTKTRKEKEALPKELRDLGSSTAIIQTDSSIFAKDDVVRRMILNIGGEDSFHLNIANQLQKHYKQNVRNAGNYRGAYYDRESDATFSLFKYPSNPQSIKTVKSIPYHRVVVGNFPKGYFKDKVVIIGSQYISKPEDFVFTPFGRGNVKSSKLNIHGQIIQSMSNHQSVIGIPSWVTDIIAVLIALVSSFVISKVQPAKGLIITVSILLSLFVIAYFSFLAFGIWFKISHSILSIFVVYYIWFPFRAIGEYQTRYAFQEETKALKKVDKLKHNFISLMSHDLKTPVAKIAGIADILRVQYDNSQDQKGLLDNIILSTKELNNFITSILDLTKVESREVLLKIENKDVNTLVEGTIDKLKFEANSQQMQINTDLSPLYPIKLDVNLINRVLGNIIGNAIKYSGEGTHVDVKTWDDERWVYIEVKDNGIGINEEEIENIFEKFYRVKNDDSHKIKGSGLGLYLVKYFIELHEGEIGVESTLGEGTKFLIKLKNE